MDTKLHVIPVDLLSQYTAQLPGAAQQSFEDLHDSDLSIASFSFYTSVSAVFSSKIEGEAIELDSYIKHKRLGAHFLPDYTRKTDDLYSAYIYAQGQPLNEHTLMQAHALLTTHILQSAQRGRIRAGNMFVLTGDGRIEYVAATPTQARAHMALFFTDLAALLAAPLTFAEVLFFASMLHLVFVKIHPFEDGNGRTARLLEKWFIAQKLGAKAWYMETERIYYLQHQVYYTHLRALGLDYEMLDYSKALPFTLLLPRSLYFSS